MYENYYIKNEDTSPNGFKKKEEQWRIFTNGEVEVLERKRITTKNTKH